jgi:hypothetical protein
MDKVVEHLSSPRGSFLIRERKPSEREQSLLNDLRNLFQCTQHEELVLEAHFSISGEASHKQWNKTKERYDPPFEFSGYSIGRTVGGRHFGIIHIKPETFIKLEKRHRIKLSVPIEWLWVESNLSPENDHKNEKVLFT